MPAAQHGTKKKTTQTVLAKARSQFEWVWSQLGFILWAASEHISPIGAAAGAAAAEYKCNILILAM